MMQVGETHLLVFVTEKKNLADVTGYNHNKHCCPSLSGLYFFVKYFRSLFQ